MSLRHVIVVALLMAVTAPCRCAYAETIIYAISGQLEEGGVFEGRFGLLTTAEDQEGSNSLGRFDLVDFDLRLTDTELFFLPSSSVQSGSAKFASLFQSESTREQALLLTFFSDPAGSSVGAVLDFGPFYGDVNVANPIPIDSFIGGYFDGTIMSPVVSLSISVVPEPTSALFLSGTVAVIGIRRRRR